MCQNTTNCAGHRRNFVNCHLHFITHRIFVLGEKGVKKGKKHLVMSITSIQIYVHFKLHLEDEFTFPQIHIELMEPAIKVLSSNASNNVLSKANSSCISMNNISPLITFLLEIYLINVLEHPFSTAVPNHKHD